MQDLRSLGRGIVKVSHRELLTFLAVGGAGYASDVVAFNRLRDLSVLGGVNPMGAKILAVAIAMVVTYLGNRMLTWRHLATGNRRREVGLFGLFNLVGLMISVALLYLSHDLLGLTTRLADNIAGNVVGVGLGTAFRYWAYQRFVFVGGATNPDERPTALCSTTAIPAHTGRGRDGLGELAGQTSGL